MKTSIFIIIPFLALAVFVCVGCKNSDDGGDSPAAAQAAAETIFIQRCAACHGRTGAGDGAIATNLSPKPRNLQDAAWQSSVDDTYLENIIKLGGLGVGKSAAMPPNPDLAGKNAAIKALVTKVRSLKK